MVLQKNQARKIIFIFNKISGSHGLFLDYVYMHRIRKFVKLAVVFFAILNHLPHMRGLTVNPNFSVRDEKS